MNIYLRVKFSAVANEVALGEGFTTRNGSYAKELHHNNQRKVSDKRMNALALKGLSQPACFVNTSLTLSMTLYDPLLLSLDKNEATCSKRIGC